MKKNFFPFTLGLLLLSLSSSLAGEYRPVTPRQARKVLLNYCRTELENVAKSNGKPEPAYRATFERAEAGEVRALKAIYFDPKYMGGENENYDVVPGTMCIAVGDKKITTFLKSLSPHDCRDTLDAIIWCFIPPAALVLPFEGKPEPTPTQAEVNEAHRWLQRHFPRMVELDKVTSHFHD